MNKKKIIILATAIVLIVLCIIGFVLNRRATTPSEPAVKIVTAMLHYPNPDLFDPEAMVTLGGTPLTPEDKAKKEAAVTKINNNWDKAVGAYFGHGYLKAFLNNTPAAQYLAYAWATDTQMMVKNIGLKIKDKASETLLVTVLVGQVEQQLEISVHYDLDGKIKEVIAPHLK